MPDDPAGRSVFDFDGKHYVLPAVTIDDRKAFHAWCNSRAIAEVAATATAINQDGYTNEQYEDAYERMMAKVGAGWWSWGSPGCRQKILSSDGLSYLCWTSMKRMADQKKLKLEDIRSLVETQAGFDTLWEHYLLANANPTAAPA